MNLHIQLSVFPRLVVEIGGPMQKWFKKLNSYFLPFPCSKLFSLERLRSTESVHCTITGPCHCLRMCHRPSACTLQHVTVPIRNYLFSFSVSNATHFILILISLYFFTYFSKNHISFPDVKITAFSNSTLSGMTPLYHMRHAQITH